MSSTVPSPYIDIGIRPMIPATENRQARGMAKTSAYGARKPRPLPVPRPAPSALVIARLPAYNRTEPQFTPDKQQVFLRPCSQPRQVPPAYRRTRRSWLDGGMPAYDAFLLLSFGGPEGPEDVPEFLENVTRGRGVPKERLAEVAEHYYAYGGVSPINAQCRDMLAAIGPALRAGGTDLPLYWGNRNWHPLLEDTVRQMAADGIRHAIAFA